MGPFKRFSLNRAHSSSVGHSGKGGASGPSPATPLKTSLTGLERSATSGGFGRGGVHVPLSLNGSMQWTQHSQHHGLADKPEHHRSEQRRRSGREHNRALRRLPGITRARTPRSCCRCRARRAVSRNKTSSKAWVQASARVPYEEHMHMVQRKFSVMPGALT
ncbi:hypothetical protein PYCCODRAFT_58381 [Trametes coccinea BRFM310]|uniref:Uncharacterized protein n=1 Tax=Trametes coccinea (strain BRFM310) TaxID=1353009 RepID=A0A1Y2IVQ4_TRAC3|nr:hypothetical protein PYCCODRAFT_58381 [Trametes coccinea BRFM310]